MDVRPIESLPLTDPSRDAAEPATAASRTFLPGDPTAALRLRKLRELGLTEYQAKAYTALLQLGKGTAAQVARVTDVPRNKLYPVMQQLNQLGIVEILLGEVQIFRPLPLDGFLRDRLAVLRARVAELDRTQADLAGLFQPGQPGAPATPGGYRLFHGRANTLDQSRTLLRAAREEIRVVASAPTAQRMLASGEAELLHERLEDGLRLSVVFGAGDPPAVPSEGIASRVASLGLLLGPAAAIHPEIPPGLLVLAIDGETVLQAQLQPDDASLTEGSDVSLVAAAPLLARMAAHYNEKLRGEARPVDGSRPG